MSLINGIATPASTATSTGIIAPTPSDNGTRQCGSYIIPVGSYNYEGLDSVPSQTKVYITGVGVARVGAPNQSSLQVSLTAGTVQLTGHVSTETNVNTDPATGTVVWISRNKMVATVNTAGLVTLVGRGECDIEARYSRQANSSWAGATPSPTESMAAYAILNLVVTA
jgi:hypothetical protein